MFIDTYLKNVVWRLPSDMRRWLNNMSTIKNPIKDAVLTTATGPASREKREHSSADTAIMTDGHAHVDRTITSTSNKTALEANTITTASNTISVPTVVTKNDLSIAKNGISALPENKAAEIPTILSK